MVLTEQQSNIATSTVKGVLVVKGAAGSGKTLVALHRADYLAKQDNNLSLFNTTPKKIIFLTYTNSMIHFLEKKMKEVNREPYNNTIIEFSTVDKLMYQFFKCSQYADYKGRNDFYPNKMIFKKLYDKLPEKFRSAYSQEFLLDEISWINYRGYHFNREKYIDSSRKKEEGKGKIPDDEKNIIYDLMREYKLKRKAVQEIEAPDKYKIVIKEFDMILEKFNPNYSHIIIDESQDFPEIKLEFLKKLYEKSSFPNKTITFLYDTAQTIFENSYLGSGNSFLSLGIETRGRTKSLTQSYRTTADIHRCAYELVKDFDYDDDGQKNEINFLNDTGIKPIFTQCNSLDEEDIFISETIELFVEKFGYKYDDFYILTLKRPGDNHLILEKHYKGEISYSNDFEENKIKAMAFNGVKGLENKIVFIKDFNSIDSGKTEEENIHRRKQLYTAMTRAQEMVFVTTNSTVYHNDFLEVMGDRIIRHDPNIACVSDIIRFEIDCKLDFIESNVKDRFSNMISYFVKESIEIRKQKKLEEEKLLENEKKIKLELEQKSKRFQDEFTANLKDELEMNFSELSVEAFKKLLSLEWAYRIESSIEKDYSGLYTGYASIIEYEIHEFLKNMNESFERNFEGVGLFKILEEAKKYKKLQKYISELQKLSITNNRNKAVHSLSGTETRLEKLRNYLIEEKNLQKIIKSLREIEEDIKKQEKGSLITLTGKLYGEGAKLKIKNKEYFSYLINNDIMAIALKKYKSRDNTEYTGKYINSRNEKIFLIESIKN